MSVATLLFSTDLRSGYADAEALSAAIQAGTHPIFAPSSVEDLPEYASFDDAVTYQGRGTVRVNMGAWLDHVLASPAVDIWQRLIFRWSPTFETVNLGPSGNRGPQLNLYDNNVSYEQFVSVLAYANDGGLSLPLPPDSTLIEDEASSSTGYSLIPAQIHDGSWRDLLTHIVRVGNTFTKTFWVNRARYQLGISNKGLGFPDLGILEFGFYGSKDGSVEFPYDNENDYVHVSLLESYAGGDPYGLLRRSPSHRRNARRLALGLLYEETEPGLVGVGV